MTMQPSLAHTESKIAYFQFFRIYHDPAVLSGSHLLFNNSRQRIPLLVEVLARNDRGQQVLLSDADLAAIRLIQIGANNRPVGGPTPHDVGYDDLDGWSSYHEEGLFEYDETFIRHHTTSTTTEPAVQNETAEDLQLNTQKISIWVATSDNVQRHFGAVFGDHISAEVDAILGKIALVPKTLNQTAVTFSDEEKLAYQFGGERESWWWRMYHYYVSARISGQVLPLKFIDMRGLWWDQGSVYKTEYSFCVAAHAGETQPTRHDLPKNLGRNDSAPLERYPIRTPPFTNPVKGQVIVLMCLDSENVHFHNGNELAAECRERDGDITDIYGNVYAFTFRYTNRYEDDPGRALKFIQK